MAEAAEPRPPAAASVGACVRLRLGSRDHRRRLAPGPASSRCPARAGTFQRRARVQPTHRAGRPPSRGPAAAGERPGGACTTRCRSAGDRGHSRSRASNGRSARPSASRGRAACRGERGIHRQPGDSRRHAYARAFDSRAACRTRGAASGRRNRIGGRPAVSPARDASARIVASPPGSDGAASPHRARAAAAEHARSCFGAAGTPRRAAGRCTAIPC